MHYLFLILLLLSFGTVGAREAYSLEWLRSGCIGFSKFLDDSEELTKQESDDAMEVGIWLQGFMQAVQMLGYSSEGAIKPVPREWMNSVTVSDSLLAYLNEFEQKNKIRVADDLDAKTFVRLWFDVKHPEVKPIEAYAYEQLFLKTYYPDAFDAQRDSDEKEPGQQTMQIEINSKKISILIPDGLVRLDGRMKSLDDAIAKMAEPTNNRVYAVFGTPEDSRLIDEGKFPKMSRTVSVQHNTGLPAITSRDNFAKLCRGIVSDLPKVDQKLSEHFDRIEEAASRAMTDVTAIKSTMEFGEMKSLGIFSIGEDYLCHSLILHLKGAVGEHALGMIQATSVVAIRTQDQVVTIYANTPYTDAKDLAWTRDICMEFVSHTTGTIKKPNKAEMATPRKPSD